MGIRDSECSGRERGEKTGCEQGVGGGGGGGGRGGGGGGGGVSGQHLPQIRPILYVYSYYVV